MTWLGRRFGFGADKPLVVGARLEGVIGRLGNPNGLNLARVEAVLSKAFRTKRAKAVALFINSPGGSPAQSGLIFRRIRRLAEKHEKPVFTFVEDVAASGGYWLALAGDRVVACPESLVGSIGVISASFGFVEAIGKLGIERRVYTTGEHKSLLDPFRPEQPGDIAVLREIQDDLFDQFKTVVRERRGAALAEDDGLFSGRVWTGKQALAQGLVDEVSDPYAFLRQKFGDEVRVKFIPLQRSWFRLSRFTGNDWATLAAMVDERHHAQRFGL
ncbi:MAG: S49 family peptidase [Geminicoccaceae bacterium]